MFIFFIVPFRYVFQCQHLLRLLIKYSIYYAHCHCREKRRLYILFDNHFYVPHRQTVNLMGLKWHYRVSKWRQNCFLFFVFCKLSFLCFVKRLWRVESESRDGLRIFKNKGVGIKHDGDELLVMDTCQRLPRDVTGTKPVLAQCRNLIVC